MWLGIWYSSIPSIFSWKTFLDSAKSNFIINNRSTNPISPQLFTRCHLSLGVNWNNFSSPKWFPFVAWFFGCFFGRPIFPLYGISSVSSIRQSLSFFQHSPIFCKLSHGIYNQRCKITFYFFRSAGWSCLIFFLHVFLGDSCFVKLFV